MSKFLKVMALSKKPSDFRKPAAGIPDPAEKIKDTAPLEDTVPLQTTVVSEETVSEEQAKDTVSLEGTVVVVEPSGALKDTESSKDAVSFVSSRATVPSKGAVPFVAKTPEKRGSVSSKETVSRVGASPPRIYACRTVQDGHSFAEDRLYSALWNWNQAREETSDTKLVTLGWDIMAKISGMTPRNAKENCRRLIAKLALEKVSSHDSETRTGTTYRIFGFRPILQRRREAGLEWIVRNRGGVTFVSHPSRGTVPLEVTVASQAMVTVTSKGSSEIAGVLWRFTGENQDDDAIFQIRKACQAAWPGITDSEIAALIDRKLSMRPPIKSSLVGFLATALPKMHRE